MTVNRVTQDKPKLIFCSKCYWQSNGMSNSRKLFQNTWERYPQKDMITLSGKTSEYAYKCRNCGDITWYPYEPELK